MITKRCVSHLKCCGRELFQAGIVDVDFVEGLVDSEKSKFFDCLNGSVLDVEDPQL